MRTMRVAACLLVWGIGVGRARADEPDPDVIARVTGLQPDVRNGVVKVSLPRTDLTVTVDGVRMKPFQGLTSWAAFARSGEQTVVMGDLTLAEDEVGPVMSAALDDGLEVTALHNHFVFDRPPILFMHIGGTGTTERLAGGVRHALDAMRAVRHAPAPAESFGGPAVPAESTLDGAALTAILGVPGQGKDGMLKFVFGRRTQAHGLDLGAEMGVSTWAAFAGSPQAAVVDGDFAMLESELQGVLKALRHADINVVAIHGHMTHEQPRILFLHFWAKGPAEALARGLRQALDTQAS
jgi:hypothetical protein